MSTKKTPLPKIVAEAEWLAAHEKLLTAFASW